MRASPFIILDAVTPEDLATTWREQQNAQFPYSCRNIQVLGTTLLQMDVKLGNILTASLKTDGVPRPIATPEIEELENYKSRFDLGHGSVLP